MKRVFIMYLALAAALAATGTDRFYIEDFTINPGETKQVSIILDNETQYTAFQSDIYLPEGLTVEQDDGDLIFYLTSRKSRDHIIMGQYRNDGAIRIMSYSLQVKPYSGNNGALVTFNVTASSNFDGGTIELKNSLFTTLDEQEIQLANETCRVQNPLKNLTGEIVFELVEPQYVPWYAPRGDEDYEGAGYCFYRYLYISYSGDEDVDFKVLATYHDYDYSDLDTIDLSQNPMGCISWDSQNKRYVVLLYDDDDEGQGIAPFSLYYLDNYHFTQDFHFDVTITAPGYENLSDSFSFTNYRVWTLSSGPGIIGGMTDLGFYIRIGYEYSVHYCDLYSTPINEDESDDSYWYPIYAFDRGNHGRYITVKAGHKTATSEFCYTTKTFWIPARECRISISESTNNGNIREYFILYERDYYDSSFFDLYGEAPDALGGSFAVIEEEGFKYYPFDVFDQESDDKYSNEFYNGHFIVLEGLSITIDDTTVYDEDFFTDATDVGFAINLLPYGDIFGGEHHIVATATDGSISLSTDTVFTIHPVAARVTAEALMLDMASDMGNLILNVDSQDVELSTDGQAQFYALERLDHEYTVTAKVGIILQAERGLPFEFWTTETTIVVPAKASGDVNDDGFVNVADVTVLIAAILNSTPLDLAVADLNGDGIINVADVTTLIQIILNN